MNARRRPYALAAFALSCAFAVPHMAYAQDELCDGIDNDQDGTVDETCDCADRFVEPENRNLSIFHLGSHDDGRIAAYGANDFFEISAQGITRTEAPGRLLIDANGLSVTLRAARAYVTENGVEREIGRSTIRDVSRAQVVGTRFETALALVRRHASEIAAKAGAGGYELQSYTQGIDSETLGARRYSLGVIRLLPPA